MMFTVDLYGNRGLDSRKVVHWASIKIQAKVHYFVTILEHKVNTQNIHINELVLFLILFYM